MFRAGLRWHFASCVGYAKIPLGGTGMNLTRGAATLLGMFVLIGCGGDDKATVAVGASGGDGGMSFPTTRRDAGSDASVPVSSTSGPIVKVMSPLASSDPVQGPVLAGPSVDVQCEVKARAGVAVDPTKVVVAIYTLTGKDALATVPATLQGTDLYGASVPLNTVPTGPVRFRCSATDKAASSPLTGWYDVYTYYDGGPVITFTNLNEMSVIARGTDKAIDLSVQFKVEAARLSADDTGADVADVKLFISEREVALDPPKAGAYLEEVDFYDFFSGAPVESVTLSVTATNKRSGVAATAKKQIIVKVDGQGPTISITAPALVNGLAPIVGGTVAMAMTITDDLAGVAAGDDKLFAEIAGKLYPLKATTNDSYGFTFEASQFNQTSNISALIHAFDKAGNESRSSYRMNLDTVAPWVSLDPAGVRLISPASPPQCSAAFDPLGDSPSDGQVVGRATRFRAFVWERGIEINQATEVWIAGVRDGSVSLYAQDNPAVPLVVNRAGDKTGRCDAIHGAPAMITFSGVPTGGGPPISSFGTAEDLMSAPLPAGCDVMGGTAAGPKCLGSEMTYVVSHTMVGRPPAVYAQMPTAGTDTPCTGISFDTGLASGWTCVVAAAYDRTGATGNLGISKPIRVCRWLKDGDCEGAQVGDHRTPPAGMTCTDGCVPPDDWSKQPTDTRVLPL
ncbi:MAG: hypothetical protein JWN48_3717 [Myxococcaceae bacterium]|nr:hypothetical protein [Myxococcaceae bacterium]